MASRHENLARRIVREIWAFTGGYAGRWAMVNSIARRLLLRDPKEVAGAIALAKERGWIEVEMHSVRLTQAGRSLLAGDAKR